MLPKVLLIEDDPTLVHALETTLGLNYSVIAVSSELDALSTLTRTLDFQAVIVDEVLQSGSGLNVIRHIKKHYDHLPIVVITAQATKALAIECLNLGVHRFVEKPFGLGELVDALKTGAVAGDVELKDGWKLRKSRRRVEHAGNDACLTPIEYRIVEYLVENKGRCVPREELVELLWAKTKVSNNALDTHLSALRKKAKPLGDCIKVTRGRGYWWDA